MIIQKQLGQNLTVHYSETLSHQGETITKVRFFCTFFGANYVADISRKSVEKNWSSVEAEGPSVLFESFTDQMEDEQWDEMKALFHAHVKEAEEAE